MRQKILEQWPRRLTTLKLVSLGALSALSMPPVDAWWVLFVTTPLALIIMKRRSRGSWSAFANGWLFGAGFFLAALHWVAFAFFVNPENDLWMMPIAVGALATGMAVFWGLAAVLAAWLSGRGYPMFVSWPLSISGFEWLRGHVLTGFPWAVAGQAADGMRGVEQLASVIGMNGLTLAIWLWAAAPLAFMGDETRRHRIGAAAILAFLPLALIWGEWRLAQNPTSFVAGTVIRLVQPNINQSDKWREGNARKIFDQLKAMTAAPSATGKPVTHVIWPESAVPFLIDESEDAKAELRAVLGSGRILLTGAVRRAAPSDEADYFTSILIFDHTAKILGTYDKWHLVPGGEFLPLAWLLEPLGLRKVVNLPGSFKAGHGPTTLDVPGLGPTGLSICYEAIFPGAISDPQTRARLLVNVTNDGWFGTSAGPYQHLAQLRLRAIELGLPAARAANTGISAFIDPLGRELLATPLNTTADSDGLLPQPLFSTLYSRFGEFSFLVMLVSTIVLGQILKKL